jgi:hypothetical protein
VQDAHSKNAHEHTGSAETLRPSLRHGFTAYFELSLVTGFLPPSLLRIASSNNLTPAPGRQDHTTSPYAAASFVCAYRARCCRVHRIPRHVRDDRETPLCVGTGWRKRVADLGGAQNEIFFPAGLDDPNQLELVQEIRFFVQVIFGVVWGRSEARMSAI